MKKASALLLILAIALSTVSCSQTAEHSAESVSEVQSEIIETTTEAELLELVDKLNQKDSVKGILVQLPLPKHKRILKFILSKIDQKLVTMGFMINAHVLEIDAGVQTRGADFARSFGVTGFAAYVGLKAGF